MQVIELKPENTPCQVATKFHYWVIGCDTRRPMNHRIYTKLRDAEKCAQSFEESGVTVVIHSAAV